MSNEAFSPHTADGKTTTLLITSTASSVATAVPFRGDVMISVRGAAVYCRWGRSDTEVSAATAATQGFWLPQNSLLRTHIPEDSTHLAVLQDTGAATIYLTPGSGI